MPTRSSPRARRKSWRRPQSTVRRTSIAACTATSSPRSTRTAGASSRRGITSPPSFRSTPSIADLSAEERRDLAHVLRRLLVGYDRLFGFSLPYMMVMHQAPTDGGDYEGVAHFHVEFYPPNRTADKLKYLAGSETGAGAYIVDALPEQTAEALKEAVEGAYS